MNNNLPDFLFWFRFLIGVCFILAGPQLVRLAFLDFAVGVSLTIMGFILIFVSWYLHVKQYGPDAQNGRRS